MAYVYWIHLPEHTNFLKEGYIGYTSRTVEERWKGHIKESSRARNLNYPVYNAMRKYGEAIQVTTLVEGPEEYCLELEFKLRPERKIGWNLQMGGNKGTKGVDVTAETRAKISAAGKGRKQSDKQRQALRDANLGRKLAPEVCQKMSDDRKGKPRAVGSALKQKETLKHAPWRVAKTTTECWASADMLYQFHEEHPEVGANVMAQVFKTTESKLSSVLKKLREGWSPKESLVWSDWVSTQDHKLDTSAWSSGQGIPTKHFTEFRTARYSVWQHAFTTFDLISDNKSVRDVHEALGFDRGTHILWGVRDRILSGWNPYTDIQFCEWIDKHKKEAVNAQTQPA